MVADPTLSGCLIMSVHDLWTRNRYRLGALGFLQSQGNITGNYGILDQR